MFVLNKRTKTVVQIIERHLIEFQPFFQVCDMNTIQEFSGIITVPHPMHHQWDYYFLLHKEFSEIASTNSKLKVQSKAKLATHSLWPHPFPSVWEILMKYAYFVICKILVKTVMTTANAEDCNQNYVKNLWLFAEFSHCLMSWEACWFLDIYVFASTMLLLLFK